MLSIMLHYFLSDTVLTFPTYFLQAFYFDIRVFQYWIFQYIYIYSKFLYTYFNLQYIRSED